MKNRQKIVKKGGNRQNTILIKISFKIRSSILSTKVASEMLLNKAFYDFYSGLQFGSTWERGTTVLSQNVDNPALETFFCPVRDDESKICTFI